jgi:hypothetical protein
MVTVAKGAIGEPNLSKVTLNKDVEVNIDQAAGIPGELLFNAISEDFDAGQLLGQDERLKTDKLSFQAGPKLFFVIIGVGKGKDLALVIYGAKILF